MRCAHPRRACYTPVLTFFFASAFAAAIAAGEPDAERMMITAHDSRAIWHGLPGFTAEIVVSTNGEVLEGGMSVSADGELELDFPESANSDWTRRRLRSLVSHRMPRAAERKFDVSFADNDDAHPLGRLIRFNEDRLHSVYRIQKDVITEVHRVMGDSSFTITVIDSFENDEGQQLPHVYTVSWRNADSGRLEACEVVTNMWVRVGRWDLPAKLLVVRTEGDGNRDVRQVVMRNHRLQAMDVEE